MTHIASLARYPVKACGAEPLTEAEVTEAGLRHDRVMAVVDGTDVLTQREHPVLATVRPVLDDASLLLGLHTPGRPGQASGVVRLEGDTRTVTVFGEPVEVVDQDRGLSEWFSDLVGRSVTLVAAPEHSRRGTPGAVPGRTVLADEGSVSLHSLASVAALNAALESREEAAVPADRFRANIVVDGCDAHAEDRCRSVEVGDVLLQFAQTNPRCVVTTVDQSAGRRSGPEPLRTLSRVRRAPDGGVLFGVYLVPERGGRVHLGDPVRLVGSSAPPE